MPAKNRPALWAGAVAASIHLIIFFLACAISFSSNQGFMGGQSYHFFQLLWIADLPFSIFSDMFIFTGHPVAALALWVASGTAWWFGLGTAWWYVAGYANRAIQTRVRRDIERMKMDQQ